MGIKILKRLCSLTGIFLILLVIFLCSMLVLPEVLDYHMYHVLSGSMEPEMPVGSLIYVHAEPPEEVEENEIIAFYSSLENTGIITHRVVKNNVVSGIFRTKGDANGQEDPLPVPYDNYIGRVAWILPGMGAFLTGMTSVNGKAAAAGVVVLGVLLNLAGSHRKKE